MAKEEAEKTLDSLRLKPDQKFFNHFEWVWLKAVFDESGKQKALTDCCEVLFPCEWHKAMETANMKSSATHQ